MGRDEQLGGERVYRLVSDWDVIRQSFVRGNKAGKTKKTTKTTKTRQPEGDGLHHEDCANGSPALPCPARPSAVTSRVHFVPS